MTDPTVRNSPAGEAGYYLHTYTPKVPLGPCQRCGLGDAAIPHARPVSRYPLPLLAMVAGVGVALLIVLAAVGFLFHRSDQQTKAQAKETAARRAIVNAALAQDHANDCALVAAVPNAPLAAVQHVEDVIHCPHTTPQPFPAVTVSPGPTTTVSVPGPNGQVVPGPTTTRTLTVPGPTVTRQGPTVRVTSTATARVTCLPLLAC